MDLQRPVYRAVACLGLALLLLCSQGCSRGIVAASGVGEATRNYWLDRGKDLLDVVDLGISFSEEPRFALYANELSLLPLGCGAVDGYVLGIGGGNFGWMRFSSASAGALVWGYEGFGYGGFDRSNLAGGNAQGVGIAGLITGPLGRPGGQLSSVHQLHFTWIGAIANANFLQAVDLVLGLVGLDICGDDGCRYGLWPWETEAEPSAYATELYRQVSDPPTFLTPSDGSYCWGRALSPLIPGGK